MNDPHMASADIGFSSAESLLEGLTNRQFTSVELVNAFLERISAIDAPDQGLNSILALNANALEQASVLDKSENVGPLHGLPIVIKDNIQAIGLPATAGSLALANRPVTQDAELVARLRKAGAVILGATNLSEWANIRSSMSTSGWSAVGGLTANPWKYKYSAGGSSSGSGASVAAGLTPLAVGTETDGSIVCPASFNGCVGIKPTVGVVSRDGVVPISNSQDSPGSMARSVRDAALLLEVLSGQSGFVDVCENSDAFRVGIVGEWLSNDDQANALFADTCAVFAKAGILLSEISIPKMSEEVGEDEGTVLFHEHVEDLDAYLLTRAGSGVTSLADVIEFNSANSDDELKYFHQDYLELAADSGGRNAKYTQARKRNLDWALNKVLLPAISQVDVLIGVPYGPAWLSTLGLGDDFSKAGWMTHAPAIAGWPIGSIPMGLVDGLPIGLGITARAHDEHGLIRAMSIMEKALGFGVMRPNFIR